MSNRSTRERETQGQDEPVDHVGGARAFVVLDEPVRVAARGRLFERTREQASAERGPGDRPDAEQLLWKSR